MNDDGVIDLTPDDRPDVTLPLPPRTLAAVPATGPVDEPPADADEPPATVELRGRRFPVGDQPVPTLAMMKLATIAKRHAALPPGQRPTLADELESASIVLRLLQATIAADAWDEFEAHADACGADAQELQSVLQQAAEVRAARPTRPSSLSSGGPTGTGPSSAAASSSPGSSVPMGSLEVQRRLEAQGRPDIAQVVLRAREASTRLSTG